MLNNLNKIFSDNKTIKNYKEMCILLQEKITGGTSRIAQHKEWERYFKFYKNGHKYIIEEVYEEIMSKKDDRKNGNNSIYVKYIETIILHLLSVQIDQTMICTKKSLFTQLGMTSLKYIDNSIRGLLVKTYQFKQNDIDDFDSRASKILDRILFSALNNLQNRCLLNWRQELHIRAKNESGKTDEWVADDEEIRRFVELKYEVLQEMGISEGNENKYDKLYDIYLYRKADKFYKLLDEKIKQECNWDGTHISYRIIYTKKNIINAIPRTEKQLQVLQDNQLEENKSLLNDTIIIALNQNAKSHYDNLHNKFFDEYDQLCVNNGYNLVYDIMPIELNSVELYLPNSSYVETQEKIADKLVKI